MLTFVRLIGGLREAALIRRSLTLSPTEHDIGFLLFICKILKVLKLLTEQSM